MNVEQQLWSVTQSTLYSARSLKAEQRLALRHWLPK